LATTNRQAWLSPWVTSSFLLHDRLSVGERGFDQVVAQLHRLVGPIYQHAIGTFNTCSWGRTHRSLTDTGRDYNHLIDPSGLRLSNLNIASSKSDMKHLSLTCGLIYRSIYLRLAMANLIQRLSRSSRVAQKVFIM
jgi:hypothetical protein